MIARSVLRSSVLRAFPRYYREGTTQSQGVPSDKVNENVPGLSSAVVRPAKEPVGPGVDPGKGGAYKVPEYFCYDNMSYFEAEIEMTKFRLPPPSALKNSN